MNDKKYVVLKAQVDVKTDAAFRKIVAVKNTTNQELLEIIIKTFILENIDLVLGSDIKDDKAK